MQGVMIVLLLIGNLLLTGCGNSQSQMAMPQTPAPESHVATQEIVTPSIEEAPIAQTADAATEPSLLPSPAVKSVTAPKKVRHIAVKDSTLITAPAQNLMDTPAVTPAVVAAPTAAPAPSAAAFIPPPPEPVSKQASNWQPNEVHLIRGNELIAGLQREMGRKPNKNEMQQRLQSHMGLSAPQAQQVISNLGLQ